MTLALRPTTRSALLAVALVACAAGCAQRAERSQFGAAGRDLVEEWLCDEPEEGCPCAGNQPPSPCRPDRGSQLNEDGTTLCFEGTRYCRDGRFTACEDVRAFTLPAPDPNALVDQISDHPQCSDCEPNCYVIEDGFNPDDGPLDGGVDGGRFADGVVFHGSGSGITLEAHDGGVPPEMLDGGAPTGSLFVSVGEGLTGTAEGRTHQQYATSADVYLLLDRSTRMLLETQELSDDAQAGSGYVPATLSCADGDTTLLGKGMTGALACMIDDVRVGGGMFRDLPFAPYSEDQSLSEPARSADAKREFAYEHAFDFTADMSSASSQLAAIGALESSGDPDYAGSQIPALNAIATGTGMYTGLYRRSVPDAATCGSGDGYPCFRTGADRIVVVASDSPMHNGPASMPYPYESASLQMSLGTGPAAVVPDGNDDWSNAFVLSSDAASELRQFTGNSSSLGAHVSASSVGCDASDSAPDAVFRFDVTAPGGGSNTTPILVSAEGTGFASTLAVFDSPPQMQQTLPATMTNERFSNARALGDLHGRWYTIDGNTLPMEADLQGSLYGAECGASSFSGDAVYSFNVDSAAGPTPVELSVDMDSNRPVLAVMDGAGQLPIWPRVSNKQSVSGNPDASTPAVITLPATPYVTLEGSTTGLGADYDTANFGGGQCSPQSDAEDVAFKIHVSGQRRLRFDTDSSSFDTVLSLHSQPPTTRSAPVTRRTAASTHMNLNEDAASAYSIGTINGQSLIFEGDTSAMSANVTDTFGCGLDNACNDAVYRISVSARTTVRMALTGTGFLPGAVLTRFAPDGVSGAYGSAAVGGEHTCALSGGEVHCWGADDSGQLGDGGVSGDPDSTSAVKASGLSGVAQICAGDRHSCAVLRDGRVGCWGRGANGRLGTGGTADEVQPVLLSEFGAAATLGSAVQVACGEAFSCALLQDGRVACFGENGHGQLGDGTTTERATAALVTTAERFEQIEAGQRHACAVRASDDAVFCWGEGAFGKLGDGATSDNLVPARAGTLSGVRSVALGADHSCAALSSGRVQCWGANQDGQLGLGSSDADDHLAPADVVGPSGTGALLNAKQVSAGRAHGCALTLEGLVYCWGDDGANQLGNGATGASSSPGKVATIADIARLFGAYDHGCALERDDTLHCWGDNGHGQLGDGSTTPRTAPIAALPGSGAVPLAFGTGELDAGVAKACRSLAEPAEPGCKPRLNGSRAYQFCNDQPRTWAGAAQACNGVGMDLVTVNSTGENGFIASQLDAGERSWLGVKRESTYDWLGLSSGLHFETLTGDRLWYTYATTRCVRYEFGVCVQREDYIRGDFVGPSPSDLISSYPSWSSSSTWISRVNPSPASGYNCATVNSSGKWETDTCAGSGYDGRGGRFASDHFSGGAEHTYVCEERLRTTDVELDPGEYFITFKGANDGVTGNSCAGAYELSLTDLGAGSGFIACDDNGVPQTTDSAIEATLNEGDYYVLLKGRRAGDGGTYRLTVRDLDAVTTTEVACDTGGGSSDPATVSFMAEPGKQYYAVVKGFAPEDENPYTFVAREGAGAINRLACDASSSPNGNPELTVDLRSGTYYAVLKGNTPSASGDYALTVGGASPLTDTFVPASYDETVAALRSKNIRVATVLSCAGNPDCDDARAQAEQLASDTNGVARTAATPADLAFEIVRAVEQLEAADEVTGSVVFAPDMNPGFTPVTVTALPDAANRCAPTPSGPSFSDCLPGATPSFGVSVHNPALMPVPFSSAPDGAYRFTLHVESSRGGVVFATQDLPLVVLPTGAPPPGTYTSGSYFQDLDGRGCDVNLRRLRNENPNDDELPVAFQRPSWDVLEFDADVRPDTRLDFYVCTAKTLEDLAACNGGSGKSSGRKRALTVTAGTGAGTPCMVATQSTDCPDGYCSPYTRVCNHLEGASCLLDTECPGTADGRCRNGPSAASIGRTCEVLNLQADPSTALDGDNMQPFMRVEADLTALGDGSRTPSLFKWEAWYRCRMVE